MVKGWERGEKRELGGTRTNQFRCAPAFFRGYLLRGALNLRNYYVPVSQNEIARPICNLKKSHGHDTKGWVVVVPYSRFVKA
jgi:hypothetical protein